MKLIVKTIRACDDSLPWHQRRAIQEFAHYVEPEERAVIERELKALDRRRQGGELVKALVMTEQEWTEDERRHKQAEVALQGMNTYPYQNDYSNNAATNSYGSHLAQQEAEKRNWLLGGLFNK